jgi:hypothetical protein
MTIYRLLIAIEHALPNWPLVEEELIYSICQNILGRGKGKGRIEQKR